LPPFVVSATEVFNDYDHLLDEREGYFVTSLSRCPHDQLILDLLRFAALTTAELPPQIVNWRTVVRTALTPLRRKFNPSTPNQFKTPL